MKNRFVLLLMLIPFAVAAQEAEDSSSTGWVTVHSQPPGASVFLDSAFAGRTPLNRLSVPAGDHEMKVFFPSPYEWNAFMQEKKFRLEAGTEIESSFAFGSFLTLHSVPSGAYVLYQGQEIGKTPVFYRSNTPLHGSVTVGMDDHESETIAIQNTPSVVKLRPVHAVQISSELIVEYPSAVTPRRWTTLGSAAGMVISGVAAAYFKDKANTQFERYSATNNPALLTSTQRYDRLSLISLIVTQVTFAILTYSLLSDN